MIDTRIVEVYSSFEFVKNSGHLIGVDWSEGRRLRREKCVQVWPRRERIVNNSFATSNRRSICFHANEEAQEPPAESVRP